LFNIVIILSDRSLSLSLVLYIQEESGYCIDGMRMKIWATVK